MGNEGAHRSDLSSFCTIKVHSLICLELKKFVVRVSQMYSAIESARPRCSTGLEALCSLTIAMEKAKLLIQHCSDCSKLYLAFTADRILLRCENIRKALDLCLGQIQNMVPTLLAAKISGIIEDLRGAKFRLESSEDEAGKVIKALLKRDMAASDSVNREELEALKFAALRLKIISPVAVLLEKRSVKKLHDRIPDSDPKRKILVYFLYLLKKYAEQLGRLQTEDQLANRHEAYETQTDNSARSDEPPLEFKCPISMRIMFDPVIISSGKTYERVWIEKWFSEGHDTCPITHVRLDNLWLTPNVAMKGLISKWSSDHGITISEPCVQSNPDPVFLQKFSSFRSIASIGSSLNDLRLQVSNVSLQSSDRNLDSVSFDVNNNVDSSVESPQMNEGGCRSRIPVSSCSISLPSLSKLDSLPWVSQCKAVQDIKEQLNKKEKEFDLDLDNSYMKPLIKFLKNARDFCDVYALNDSADVLLSILSTSRIEVPSFDEDTIYTLASFLDSEITGKALEIMETLSRRPCYKSGIVKSGVLPSILKVLDTQTREFQERAMKILFNLSGNNDVAYHILYLGCIPKLVPFLGDPNLAGYCLGIIKIICDTEEGKSANAETSSCIDSIATLVENGTELEQETAMQILLSLSYEHREQCLHINMRESIIRSLFNMKINGNQRRMIVATELLQILGHRTAEADVSDCSTPSVGFSTDSTSDSCNHPKKKKLLPSMGFAHLGRRISRFFLHNRTCKRKD